MGRDKIIAAKTRAAKNRRIFLASYAKCVMGKIAKEICPSAGDFSGLSAIFIPTAGDPYENKDFVEEDRKALEKFGAKVQVLDLKTASPDEISKRLSETDILLVAGGNTFYLMDWIIKSCADRVIRKFVANGKIYIGSSAGSIVCCPTIKGAAEFDDPEAAPGLKDYQGLNLVPDIIIPHAQKPRYFERIERTKNRLEKDGFRVLTLTDEKVIFYS